MKAAGRAAAVAEVRRLVAGGLSQAAACLAQGISVASFRRWAARLDEAGLDGLGDLPRSGRPPMVALDEDEAAHLRRVYLRSNLREGAGSMTLAARWAAKDPDSPLREETRRAILKERASKHSLPAEVRRACRASRAEVARYRDPKSGQNDGIYTPGWLRMTEDGSRRVAPGERQVWDDASVNIGVVAPWARGGDRCAERFGVRVARFQLLAALDCAGDFCPGWAYIMRPNDSYRAEDVVAAMHRVWTLNGYAPDECVLEGGPWQSERLHQFLGAAGVRIVSAQGRPNQKLVEGWFSRLWTVLSVLLPGGQVGRFRGEMAAENDAWRRCREGIDDPRLYFPTLTEFLAALDRAVNYLNAERTESPEYGAWVPAEGYGARAGKGHALPAGLRRYALPVRAVRKVRRQGMVAVTAESPAGWPHRYVFASEKAWRYDGAEVTVSFDPADIRAGAVLELARAWRDTPAGTVVDAAAACVSPAPCLERVEGVWRFGALDARGDARAIKRASRAAVGRQVAAYDERGVKARHAEAPGGAERYGFAGAAPAVPEASPPGADEEPDWAALEAEAGVLVV